MWRTWSKTFGARRGPTTNSTTNASSLTTSTLLLLKNDNIEGDKHKIKAVRNIEKCREILTTVGIRIHSHGSQDSL